MRAVHGDRSLVLLCEHSSVYVPYSVLQDFSTIHPPTCTRPECSCLGGQRSAAFLSRFSLLCIPRPIHESVYMYVDIFTGTIFRRLAPKTRILILCGVLISRISKSNWRTRTCSRLLSHALYHHGSAYILLQASTCTVGRHAGRL